MKKIKDVAKIRNIDFTKPVEFDAGNLRFITAEDHTNNIKVFPEGYVYDVIEVHYLFRGDNDEIILPIIPFGVISCSDGLKYKFNISRNSKVNHFDLDSVQISPKDLNAISEIIKLFDKRNFRQELIDLGKQVK